MSDSEYLWRMALYHAKAIAALKRGRLEAGRRWNLKAQALRFQYGPK